MIINQIINQMISSEELLKKLIGKTIDVVQLPGGFYINEKRKRGEFVVTDTGAKFIEAKSTDPADVKKYYFNTESLQKIVLLE